MRPQEPDLLVASEIDRTQEFAAGRLSLNFKKEDEMDPSVWWGQGFGMFWIFPLLFMIFMVAMMVMMFRRGACGCMPMSHGRANSPADGRDSPRQILDRRYAGGELTKDQYDQMKRDLELDRGQP